MRSAAPAVTPRLQNWRLHEDVLAAKRLILSLSTRAGPSHLQVGDRFSVCPDTLSPSSSFSTHLGLQPVHHGTRPLFLANWLLYIAVIQDQEVISSIHHRVLWLGRGKRDERLVFNELGVED